MVPSCRSSSFLLAVLLLLANQSGAQGRSNKAFARYAGPIRSVSLDLATGTITRGATVRDRTITTVVDFYNTDLSGFVGVDSGNGFCEWFDAGVKGFNGVASDCMSEIVFAYCSSMLTPGSGGPGGSVKLGFYEGYLAGGGAPTTSAAVFTLTGLPGNSASASFFTGFNCYYAYVSFPNLIAFADGPIGYSWGFLGVGTTGALAGTWPFLACVASCSGTVLPDGQGMLDIIDQYCPPGTLRSTFTFGTTTGNFTSFSMEIREATAPPTLAFYNATVTPNPDILVTSAAVLGATWAGTISRSSGPSITGATVSVRTGRIPLANGVQGPAPLPPGAGGRILISGPPLSMLTTAPAGALVRTFGASVPHDCNLIDVHFAAQATVLGGGVRVSSAVEGTVGTF